MLLVTYEREREREREKVSVCKTLPIKYLQYLDDTFCIVCDVNSFKDLTVLATP